MRKSLSNDSVQNRIAQDPSDISIEILKKRSFKNHVHITKDGVNFGLTIVIGHESGVHATRAGTVTRKKLDKAIEDGFVETAAGILHFSDEEKKRLRKFLNCKN